MNMQPRPQTGPAAVSLSDVLALGKPRLMQLAQDPSQTIAPSWMIPTALDTINKTNAGMQQPTPQGTVAQQVMAQAVQPPHPITQGIGGLPVQPPQQQAQPGIPQPQPQQQPPVQHMAGGGAVRHFDGGGTTGSYLGRSAGSNLLPDTTGYEGMSLTEFLSSIGGSAADKARAAAAWLGATDADMKTAVRGAPAPTSATLPAAPSLTGTGAMGQRASDADFRAFANDPRNALPTPGIPGQNPTTKYAASAVGGGQGRGPKLVPINGDVPETPTAASFLDTIPKAEALAKARAELEARTAANIPEMQSRTQRQALADYAAGIMGEPGGWRGFGATNPGATRAMVTTENAGADKLQAYKDMQAQQATTYGIQADESERQRQATAESLAQQGRQFGLEKAKFGAQASFETNQNAIALFHAQAQQRANEIAAAGRIDALNEASRQHQIQLYETAYQRATQYAESVQGKTDPISGQFIDPMKPAMKQALIEREMQRNLKALAAVYGESRNGAGIKALAGAGASNSGEAANYEARK